VDASEDERGRGAPSSLWALRAVALVVASWYPPPDAPRILLLRRGPGNRYPPASRLTSLTPVPSSPSSLSVMKRRKLCFRCLSPKHPVRECRDPVCCLVCGGSGHRSGLRRDRCPNAMPRVPLPTHSPSSTPSPARGASPTSPSANMPPHRIANGAVFPVALHPNTVQPLPPPPSSPRPPLPPTARAPIGAPRHRGRGEDGGLLKESENIILMFLNVRMLYINRNDYHICKLKQLVTYVQLHMTWYKAEGRM
jgi:hypothetical protein